MGNNDDTARAQTLDSLDLDLKAALAESDIPTFSAPSAASQGVPGFELIDLLGEGGMGAVYRARHLATGTEVAVKRIRGVTTDRAKNLFRREVEAHASLAHPGITFLLDYGESRGETGQGDEVYVAMELAEQTLADLLPVHDWPTARSIIVQVLDALAYAHAREIIHRDLKPQNLLIFANAGEVRVKLADFGIAHVADHTLEIETHQLESPMGTPQYMPVEQIRGAWREYGPWTDLYALGCIAFELVCGRAPFRGRSLVDLMLKHTSAPRPPLEPRFEVPEGLETWIHRAFAALPGQRFRRAADALAALPNGHTSAGWATTDANPWSEQFCHVLTVTQAPTSYRETLPGIGETRLTHDGAKATPVFVERPSMPHTWRSASDSELPGHLWGVGLGLLGLRRTRMVGRTSERDALWDRLRVTNSGEFTCALVAGEAGVGKSRIAEWLSERSHEVGVAQTLRIIHSRTGGPADGLRGLVLRQTRGWRLDAPALLQHLTGSLTRLPNESDDAFATDMRRLCRVAGVEFDGDHGGPLTQNDVINVVARLIRRFALERPAVLWVDDVQWGLEALALVEHMANHPAEFPNVFVLATLRSDIEKISTELSDCLSRVFSAGTRIDLGPMSESEHREMLLQTLPLSHDLADRLMARAERNPLFTHQLLRHLVQLDAVVLQPDGFAIAPGKDLVLPDNLHEMWMQRIHSVLTRIPPLERDQAWEKLGLAATLGRLVDEQEWTKLWPPDSAQMADALLATMVHGGLAADHEHHWEFSHVLLVESLRRHAVATQRWPDHNRVCVQMLRSLYGGAEEVEGRVAQHLIAAQDLEDALEPLLTHAKYEYKRGNGPRRLEILTQSLDLLNRLGVRRDDERRIASSLERGMVSFYLGRTRETEGIARETLEIFPDAKNAHVVYALELLGMVNRRRGAIEEARTHLVNGLSIAEELNDSWWVGAANSELSWLELHQGNWVESETYAIQSQVGFRDAGDLHMDAWGEYYRTWVQFYRGDLAGAEIGFQHLLETASAQRFAVILGYCHQSLSNVLRYRGDFEGALDHLHHFRELAGWQMSARCSWAFEAASCYAALGRLDEHREHLALADRLAHTMEGGKYREWIDMARVLGCAMAADWPSVAETFERYRLAWPIHARKTTEHPWHLHFASHLAYVGGQHDLAQALVTRADALWTVLGRADAILPVETPRT